MEEDVLVSADFVGLTIFVGPVVVPGGNQGELFAVLAAVHAVPSKNKIGLNCHEKRGHFRLLAQVT